ncbi:MAG: hypothetical protein ABEJ79_11730 [Halolamina sp.]
MNDPRVAVSRAAFRETAPPTPDGARVPVERQTAVDDRTGRTFARACRSSPSVPRTDADEDRHGEGAGVRGDADD